MRIAPPAVNHVDSRQSKSYLTQNITWSFQTLFSANHLAWYHHNHNHFMVLFPGPTRWASARRELLDFMVQGRHPDHPAGRHSIRTNQCLPPPSPHIFYRWMPFLPPNQQHQSTEGMVLQKLNLTKQKQICINKLEYTVVQSKQKNKARFGHYVRHLT